MTFTETVLLGALAGFTIYLGLPFARLELLSARVRVALAMFAVGVLAFLFVDVMEHAFEIVEDAVDGFRDGGKSLPHAGGLALLLGAGFAAGSAGLAQLEARMRPAKPTLPPIAGASRELTGDDAMAMEREATAARAKALRTGMTIAAAISLATVLIIGFALHNATEGFGIVGPLGAVRPSWGWLALAGLVGGGPTFLGSIVGYNVTSNPLEL